MKKSNKLKEYEKPILKTHGDLKKITKGDYGEMDDHGEGGGAFS